MARNLIICSEPFFIQNGTPVDVRGNLLKRELMVGTDGNVAMVMVQPVQKDSMETFLILLQGKRIEGLDGRADDESMVNFVKSGCTFAALRLSRKTRVKKYIIQERAPYR